MPPKRISIRNSISAKVPVALVKWLTALMCMTSMGEGRLIWNSPAFCAMDCTRVLERHVTDITADVCRTGLYSTAHEKQITT